MGLLQKLWDETVAGPAPESGLGKLRKYNSFSGRSAAAPDLAAPPSDLSVSVESPSCSTPRSPGGNLKKLTRRKSETPISKSPTGYDWIVLSALER